MTPKVSIEYKEKKKQEILQAAIKVFQKKGFEPTTMKDIKEAADISFGSLYSYFSNTEEIFLKILEFAHTGEEFKGNESWTAWQNIEYFLDSQAENYENVGQSIVPVAYEYFMTSWREEKRVQILQSRYDQAIRELLAFIRKGMADGEFSPVISEAVMAKTIISTLEGLNISSLFLHKELVEAREQIQALKVILKQLLQIKGEGQ